MSYYNTTREKGEQLKANWKKAESQDEIITKYFEEYNKATPSEVWTFMTRHDSKVPITSVRRSITNLTESNVLFKTQEKRKGVYGRNEYVWGLQPYNLFTSIK